MRRYTYVLAERLGVLRSELVDRMSTAELFEWMAHDELTAAEIEFERKKAEM